MQSVFYQHLVFVYSGRRKKALIQSLIGAKLMFVIVEFPNWIKDISLLKDVINGFVVYGGILGGIFAGWLCCHKHKVTFLKHFDLVMPSVSMAQGFG